jgi:hypothetical protein
MRIPLLFQTIRPVLPVLFVSKNEASVLIFKVPWIGGGQRLFGLGGFFAFSQINRGL